MLITLKQATDISSSPIFGMKLPPASAYKFGKLLKLLVAELATFDTVRAGLIEEHNGVLREDGLVYEFQPEDIKPFQTAIDAVLASTIDVGHHFPMSIESLGQIDLSPADFMRLDSLFDVGAD